MGRSRQSWESKKYSGAFVSCRIHRLAIFIRRERMAAAPPPFSGLLVAVFIVVTACSPTWHRFASARRGVRFVFPARRPEDGKLRMLFPCRCLFFSDFAAAPQYASPCPKLAQAFPIANILGVYTVHFLQLLARTAYARSCKRMTTFDGQLLSSCPGMCM